MSQSITVALAGNPNAGKSSIFNALTGARQHVGNWPGVTVEKKEGALKHDGRDVHVVDLPGTYSLTAYSLEEIIARNFIVDAGPDVVVNVVDASNLERNLYLSSQLLEMGANVVVALNMIDVARARGIKIDTNRLSELLGAPVIPTNAKKNEGIPELLAAIIDSAEKAPIPRSRIVIQYGTEFEEELATIEEILSNIDLDWQGADLRWLSVKLLEGDSECRSKLEASIDDEELFAQVDESRDHLTDIFEDPPEIITADTRYGFVSGATRDTVRYVPTDRFQMSEMVDKILTHRLLGPLILFAVLYLVYTFTFRGSDRLVTWFEAFFTWLGSAVGSVLPDGLIQSLIVSGVIDGVGGVLGFTPLIAFMFFAIAILEDTGYMARIAFMLDRVLRGFGLHGSSMLALMVSGGIAGGCAVPGIMATRTMKEPKERLATILVAPLMNCGAKLPVYALLIGAFFPGDKAAMMFLLTLISWALALMAGRIIRSTVLAGPSAPFVLELPPYRIPTLKALLIHTWERTWMYVKKAGTVILAVSIVLWAVMTFPGLSDEQVMRFDEREAEIVSAYLHHPDLTGLFSSPEDLRKFEQMRRQHGSSVTEKSPQAASDHPELFVLMQALENGTTDTSPADHRIQQAAIAYEEFRSKMTELEKEKQRTRLKGTIGGQLGVFLSRVFAPIGFDWRTCIALVGGFAAKEVVVSTLGTAYSLGEVDPESAPPLSEKLKKEPSWNPLTAMAMILFVMLYAPCFVTLVVIYRETGAWGWTLFAMVYTTVLAYCTALLVKTVGTFLGLGVS